ncbi:acyl carrier protein [Desertibaculum subflavum]|uniref:acyl carrier protein n=1 Tax=Desertibaculum subflavum TaxID=2268458 RepID=UPI000E66112F
MSKDDIRRIVIEEIANIAPDTEPGAIDPGSDIREALDLDSMDVLNIIIALHTRLRVDIPEADYPLLLTIAGATDYLAAKLAG